MTQIIHRKVKSTHVFRWETIDDAQAILNRVNDVSTWPDGFTMDDLAFVFRRIGRWLLDARRNEARTF